MTKVVVMAFAAFALGGCVSMGTKVNEASLAQFHKGVTTEAQVETALGKPETTELDSNGDRMIAYIYSRAQAKAIDFVPIVGLFAGGATGEQTTVTFRFGPNGKLVSYSASSGKTDVHSHGL